MKDLIENLRIPEGCISTGVSAETLNAAADALERLTQQVSDSGPLSLARCAENILAESPHSSLGLGLKLYADQWGAEVTRLTQPTGVPPLATDPKGERKMSILPDYKEIDALRAENAVLRESIRALANEANASALQAEAQLIAKNAVQQELAVLKAREIQTPQAPNRRPL